jgi:hypothetical protein
VVVDLREADVLVREQAQLGDRRFHARGTGGDGIEEMAELLLVDGASPQNSVLESITVSEWREPHWNAMTEEADRTLRKRVAGLRQPVLLRSKS